jgi:hypothetical protein
MRRHEFEHVLKAAADIVKDEIVVIGSQAVFGQFADPPEALLRSLEVDVYPRAEPERAVEIDGAIGEGSRFYETYGYYAHGVGPETAKAPAGWENRLVRLELPAIRRREGRIVAWCLEVHDLVLSKLAAGRPKDLEFAIDALRARLVDEEQLRLGLDLVPEDHRDRARRSLDIVLARSRL